MIDEKSFINPDAQVFQIPMVDFSSGAFEMADCLTQFKLN
jgi:hypothetical protein